MSKFIISKTNTECKQDLNKRYILDSDNHKVICVFNPFFEEWTDKDEHLLQLTLTTLNNEYRK